MELAPTIFELSMERPISPRPAELLELPLVPQQESWYTVEARYPGATNPVIMLSRRIRGPLVADAWVRAVGAVVDRHEVLRARFVDRGSGPVQVIGPRTGLEVERIDLTDLPDADREERARALLTERRSAPFDLEHGPALASCLVRLADDDHWWTVTLHHILLDGVSAEVIERELGVCYRAFVSGIEPELPELPVQFGDYAVWLAATRGPEHDEEDVRYWTRQLAGVPALELRTDLPRPPRKGAAAGEVRRLIDAELLRGLDELRVAHRCTRNMVLVALLQVLLARWSGQDDFCVGIPVAGSVRSQPELASMVGPCNNQVAVRSSLSGDPTVAELLARVRDAVLDALDHQDLIFGRVVDALGIPREPARTRLTQVVFGVSTEPGFSLELPGVRVETVPLAAPKSPWDLMVNGWPESDGVRVQFLYDSALFTERTVEERIAGYERLLRAAVARPAARVSELA